jgi:hypothetical protein
MGNETDTPAATRELTKDDYKAIAERVLAIADGWPN